MATGLRLELPATGPEEQLDAVADAWRATFDADLARAARHLARRVVIDGAQLAALPKAARHAKWLALAHGESTSRRVIELLAHLDFATNTARELLERLEALRSWRPHPLVTAWLVAVFARQTRAPVLEGGAAFQLVFELLVDRLDHAGAEQLRGWLGGHAERIRASKFGSDFFDAGMRRALEGAEPRLAAAPALAPDDRRRLADLGWLAADSEARAPADRAALLAAVYAAPSDLAPRHVLSDWLQLQGDPYGEYLALELAPSPTPADPKDSAGQGLEAPPAQRAAAKKLLKAHGKGWFPEELHRLVNRSSLAWERGFPVLGELAAVDRTEPSLATFREWILVLANPDFEAPCFREVESWLGVGVGAHDRRPLSVKPRVRHLAVWAARWLEARPGGGQVERATEPDEVAAFVGSGLFPNVRDLAVGHDALIDRRFERRYADAPTGLVAWLERFERGLAEALPQVERLALGGTAHYERRGAAFALVRLELGARLLYQVAFDHARQPSAPLLEDFRRLAARCEGLILFEASAEPDRSREALGLRPEQVTVHKRLPAVRPWVLRGPPHG